MVVPVYYFLNRSSTKPLNRLKMLMEDFKPDKRYLMLDHFIFMLRRAVLISVIVFGWNHGFMQVSIFSIACIGVLVWKIVARPFESVLLNIQDIIFELFISVIIVIFISFSGKSTELAKSGPAHIAGMICFAIIIFLTLLSFIFSTCLFIQKCREKRRQSKVEKISKIGTIEDWYIDLDVKPSVTPQMMKYRDGHSHISDNSQVIMRRQSTNFPASRMESQVEKVKSKVTQVLGDVLGEMEEEKSGFTAAKDSEFAKHSKEEWVELF